MKRFSILVAHPWMGKGGSEATAMWTLHCLQNDFDVTLVTASDVDFQLLNSSFGTKVDRERVHLMKAPGIPGIKRGNHLVALQHSLFHRFCHKIGPRFDLCISGYNFVPFGKPSIQLVGDFSFSDELRERFYTQQFQKLIHKPSFLRSLYLKCSGLIWSGDRLDRKNDLVLANSAWTAHNLSEYCGLKSEVLFPPVALPGRERMEIKREDFSFLYIGRVSPEKEIEKIISILELVRNQGFPVTLDLAGNSGHSAYEKLITSLVRQRPWIADLGFLSGREKEAAFLKNSFGIHACQCEAFGIAAAEMAAWGCLPLVAAGCGTAEIVPFSELQFGSLEDAALKITHLLETPRLVEKLRRQVILGAEKFSAETFVGHLRSAVDSMLPKKKSIKFLTDGPPRRRSGARVSRHPGATSCAKNPS